MADDVLHCDPNPFLPQSIVVSAMSFSGDAFGEVLRVNIELRMKLLVK